MDGVERDVQWTRATASEPARMVLVHDSTLTGPPTKLASSPTTRLRVVFDDDLDDLSDRLDAALVAAAAAAAVKFRYPLDQ